MSSKAKIPAVQPGSKVCVIAPGMAFDRKNLVLSTKVLEGWGLKVYMPKGLLGSHPVSASSEINRWNHLKEALNSDARIIWAARGGYGSLHLLKYLKQYRPKGQRKILIGFSDITTLHQYVNSHWGWASLHGPHADRLHTLTSARQNELRKILFGDTSHLEFRLKAMNTAATKLRALRSTVVGGNLVTTQSTFGTSWQLKTKKKILFVEDIGERGYRVDRVLEHMWSLGLLQSAGAIVFGPFTDGEEPGGRPSRVPRVLKAFAERLNCPVFQGINSGHIPNSRALPLMTEAIIKNVSGRITISVATGIGE